MCPVPLVSVPLPATAASSFAANVEVTGAVTRLSIDGELDHASRPEVRRLLLWCSTPTILIDLAAVTFLDAAGVGSLVELAGACRAHGCEVRIVDPSGQAMRTLELTQLGGALDGRWR